MLDTEVSMLVFGVGCSRLACRQRQRGGKLPPLSFFDARHILASSIRVTMVTAAVFRFFLFLQENLILVHISLFLFVFFLVLRFCVCISLFGHSLTFLLSIAHQLSSSLQQMSVLLKNLSSAPKMFCKHNFRHAK